MKLQDKIAIVTGGGQGIGYAISERLAREGAKVYILDYNEATAQKAVAALTEQGLQAAAICCDVSDTAMSRQVVAEIEEKEGRIDILVNNAGISPMTKIWDMTEEEWDLVFGINLRGPFFLTQAVLKGMAARKRGKIVNLASISGHRGGRFSGIHYSASKGGVITMTKCMALNYGPLGINVNAIAPGVIKTSLTDSMQTTYGDVPMGRMGTAEEVAAAAFFLASEDSDYINGMVLDVNGGQLMR